MSTPDPGRLRSETRLTLNTRQAQRLVQGRKAEKGRPPIPGLTRFGAHMSQIFHCARLDDPYADLALVQVEEALEQCRENLDAVLAKAQERLNPVEGMEIGIAEAASPTPVNLAFANPYAYLAAMEVLRFDRLVRMALTGRHVGLMTRDESVRLIQDGGRPIRRLFFTPMWYRYTGVTRKDFELMTALAKKAVERFGELPQEILTGEKRAAHAPDPLPAMDLDQDQDEGEERNQAGAGKRMWFHEGKSGK